MTTTPTPAGRQYIDKEVLMRDICAWQDACAAAKAAGTEEPTMPDTIGKAIMDIAYGLGSRWNFNGYSWVDEMILDGILAATRAVALFDRNHEKQNPFGFLTFVTWRAMVNRLKKEKEHQAFKMELLLDETLQAYNTQDGDSDIEVGRNELIETYSFNS